MKFKTVQTILMAALSNQQHGVIKTHNNSIYFSFTNGDSSEDDIIAYDSHAEVISVLGRVCNNYVCCDAIESISLRKNE